MLMFDYECKNDGSQVANHLVNNSDEVVLCLECGHSMKKLLCAPAAFGFNTVSPGCSDYRVFTRGSKD